MEPPPPFASGARFPSCPAGATAIPSPFFPALADELAQFISPQLKKLVVNVPPIKPAPETFIPALNVILPVALMATIPPVVPFHG